MPLLFKIYAGREKDIYGISSQDVAQRLGTQCFDDFDTATSYLRKEAREGDLILTMGAGDIDRFVEPFEEMIKKW